VIERYALSPMAEIWSDEAVFTRWARIESCVAGAQADLGLIPHDAAEVIATTPAPEVSDVRTEEHAREHEVLSFLAAWTSAMPTDVARWAHFGLTSYDLVDCGLGVAMRDSMDLVIDAAARLDRALTELAEKHWQTVTVGRTHGIHAEPISFGHKLAGYAFAVRRSLTRLRAARKSVAVGTVSGPVGTYSTTPPSVEERVLETLGLRPEPAPTQVVSRDRHAEAVHVLAILSATIEQIALEFRLLQQTELAEVEEPRSPEYQGSSAMPHKGNPTLSERLCGLARLMRGVVTAALEDVALWHERDLVHSSVERVILPGAFNLAYYQAVAAIALVSELRVNEERMLQTLERSAPQIVSSMAYLHLLETGVERELAYRAVQAAASESQSTGRSVVQVLTDKGFAVDAELVDPLRFLAHEDVIRKRLAGLSLEAHPSRAGSVQAESWREKPTRG
jgi:adenylosuccinate lyase